MSATRHETRALPGQALRTALSAGLPAGRVLDDPDVLRSYAHDDAEWAPW